MRWFDRLGLYLIIAALALGVPWLTVGSSIFLRPVSLVLDGTQLTFVRETPFGEVDAKWWGEITLLDNGSDRDGFECPGSGRRPFQVAENDLVTATIGAWAMPCVSQGPPMVFRLAYQVMLFGKIPLRPVYFSATMNARP